MSPARAALIHSFAMGARQRHLTARAGDALRSARHCPTRRAARRATHSDCGISLLSDCGHTHTPTDPQRLWHQPAQRLWRVSVPAGLAVGRRRRHGRGAAGPSGHARPRERVARVPWSPTGPCGAPRALRAQGPCSMQTPGRGAPPAPWMRRHASVSSRRASRARQDPRGGASAVQRHKRRPARSRSLARSDRQYPLQYPCADPRERVCTVSRTKYGSSVCCVWARSSAVAV